MESWRAYSALFLWIPFTWYIFRRYPRARAALICFLGGAMFLPEVVVLKLPFFPEMGKTRIAVLSMVTGLWLFAPKGKRGHLEPWWYALVAIEFTACIGTWLTNQDTIYWGPRTLPGHVFRDAMYGFLSSVTTWVLASWLGMQCFRSERDLDDCVKLLAGAGLIYTVPILIEARMSPQMHRWIYGYAPFEDFLQAVRWGGYRPQVFMMHGLMTSLFMLGPTIAATAASRIGMRVWKLSGRTTAWILTGAIVICKSTGVWAYALLTLPLARFSSPKVLTRTATVLIVVALLYPWLRATERIPLDSLLDYAGQMSEDRQQSLKFRFDNEEMLLKRAMERPWFGWGSFGRNRVYDELGNDISVTDGGWVITMGGTGLVGYLAYFGCPFLCVLTVASRVGKLRDKRHAVKVAALNLFVAIYWFDMLPNAPYVLIPQFLGGALCSITRQLLADQRVAARASVRTRPSSQARPRPPSTRPEPSGVA